jgi:hypothetical protein
MSGELPGLPEGCVEIDTFLRKEGFECEEEHTTDCCRGTWYFKEFRKSDSNAMLRLVIRFELVISDSPFGSYNDNHELYFNDICLEIYDRQMEEGGSYYGRPEYDNETEHLRRIDMYTLRIRSYAELKQFERYIAERKI